MPIGGECLALADRQVINLNEKWRKNVLIFVRWKQFVIRVYKCTAFAAMRHIGHRASFLPQIAQFCQIYSPIWVQFGAKIHAQSPGENAPRLSQCATYATKRHFRQIRLSVMEWHE